jgi:hypothetical protein
VRNPEYGRIESRRFMVSGSEVSGTVAWAMRRHAVAAQLFPGKQSRGLHMKG